MRRITRSDERGAVAIVTVVFLASVVLAAGLITIDVGRLYTERRQLQNGADAAALAVARSCATNAVCDTSYAQPYADANANDGMEAVSEICGTGPGLAACGPENEAELTNCLEPPADAAVTPYVQVRTSTLDGSGSVISSIFGDDDTTVGACARVGWGGVESARSIALTISLCEWEEATAGGTNFAPPPPYSTPYSAELLAGERVLTFHSGALDNTTDCEGSPSGWDLPGGFGWLDDDTGDCTAEVDAGSTYPAEPGASASDVCKAALLDAWTGRSVLFVPVYNGQTGDGRNGTYSLEGWAAFVVTGYKFPATSKNSWLTGRPCTTRGSVSCLSGFFTAELMSDPISVGGPSMGASAIALSG